MLTGYGMGLGMKLFLHGRLKRGLRYIVVPVNYWRTVEFKLVWDAANFSPNDRVLDIGSPKLLSLYLAKHLGAEVYSTDIEDYFLDEYAYLRELEHIPAETYHVAVADGRHLPYDDNYFTKVFSISVIEHIPDNGDTVCINEIRRVLSPGGYCLLTIPFSPQGRNEYAKVKDFYWSPSVDSNGPDGVFFQRRYSERDIYERIINPSGMTLEKLVYVGERVMTHSSGEFCDYLPLQLGPLHPLASKLVHTRPNTKWSDLKKPLCAMLVLRK